MNRPSNPRRRNGSRRSALRARVAAMALPCHICRLPIDYSLPPGAAESYELDELDPVALGGSPFARDNVAAAHRCCNAWKAARTMGWVCAVRDEMRALGLSYSTPICFVDAAKRAEASMRSHRIELPRTSTEW